jgi:hypothetical protein
MLHRPRWGRVLFPGRGPSAAGGELADLCQGQYYAFNGVSAQKYWSKTANACVFPTAPNKPVPNGAERVSNINAQVKIAVGVNGHSPKSTSFGFTRSISLDNNQATGDVVITTPMLDSWSANVVMNFTWNSDFSLSVSFTSAFFQGVNSVTSYANSFKLEPGYVENFSVGHEYNSGADTCDITFSVTN